MTVVYDEKAGLVATLNRVEDMRWAQMTYTSALVCVGNGAFNLGKSVFNRVADLPTKIALSERRLLSAGTPVHSHSSRVILAPGIASFNFNRGDAFLTLMSDLKGEAMICGTEGSNLTAQLRGLNPWQAETFAKHVSMANVVLAKNNQAPIKIVQKDGTNIDYVFPTIATMREFCALIESQAADKYSTKQAREQTLEAK